VTSERWEVAPGTLIPGVAAEYETFSLDRDCHGLAHTIGEFGVVLMIEAIFL